MKRFNSRSKKIWSTIGIILLIVLVVSLVVALFPEKRDDGFNRVRTEWAVGNLSDGKYVADNSVNLVSDYIKFNDGFRVEIDFDKVCQFTYYMYDEDKNVIGEINGPYDSTTTIKSGPDGVCYVRFVITGFDDEDDHISKLEVFEYSNYVKIFTLSEEDTE